MGESTKATPATPPANGDDQPAAAAAGVTTTGNADASTPPKPITDSAADKAAAKELADAKARGPVALNRATHDAIGRKLPDDPDKSRAQAREAVNIREARIREDVDRVNHGLAPRWADK